MTEPRNGKGIPFEKNTHSWSSPVKVTVGMASPVTDISPLDISPRTPPPRTFPPTSLSRTFPPPGLPPPRTTFFELSFTLRRYLGVYVDGGVTMRAHINHVLSSCYGTLKQLRSIKRSLTSRAINTLVTSLVHSRLDYCNVVFAGLPEYQLATFNVNFVVHS